MASPRTVPPSRYEEDERAGNRRVLLAAAAIALLVAVPIGASVGLSWVDLPWSEPEAKVVPEWVAVPQLRATTIDGAVVKARVALDVESAAARNAIQRRIQQVGLVLEISVASRSEGQVRAPDGIAALSDDMRTRLNRYLEAEGTGVVKAVAIQDLIVNPQ
jgi:flagellar basal body-associated protein FliL